MGLESLTAPAVNANVVAPELRWQGCPPRDGGGLREPHAGIIVAVARTRQRPAMPGTGWKGQRTVASHAAHQHDNGHKKLHRRLHRRDGRAGETDCGVCNVVRGVMRVMGFTGNWAKVPITMDAGLVSPKDMRAMFSYF